MPHARIPTRSLSLPVLLCLVAPALVGPTSAGEARRAATIPDLYRVKTISGLDVSPDGASLVYAVRSTDLPHGKANLDLYRTPAAGGETRRLTWTEDADESDPIWSPDGRTIAFVARRGEQETEQIWLVPADGGEARPLTELSTGAAAPVWSPDGGALAFRSEVYPDCGADDACNRERAQRRRDGPLEAHVADDLLYRHWTDWSDGVVSHVLIVDVESGRVRDLTPGASGAPAFEPGGGTDYVFSPDGTELCYTRSPEPAASRAWSTNVDVWVVPVAPDEAGNTRPARNLTADNPAWDGSPHYSPDGRYLAYRRQERPGFESDRFRLMVLDRESGTLRDLTSDFENWVLELHWLPDSSGLLFTAPLEGRTPLYRVDLDGGAARQVAGRAYIDEFEPGPDGRTVYAVSRSMASPTEVWIFDLLGQRTSRRTLHNAELEREVDLRPAESIWVEGAGGSRIQVLIVKPHGFDPSRRYPLILNVHGGPQYMWADAFRLDAQVYPGAGYVVAFPNPHGSIGYGQPFTDAISRDWGGKVYQDLMKVTDALEQLPYVDPERIGAMGWSYGGYMMNWFQARTDRFRALASMMGIFDLPSFYLATEELWFPEWDLGGELWNSADYQRWNPAASIGNFNTPMLIVTGERDYRVPYTQSLMAFTALRRRSVPARLIVFPRSGHWPGWYEMALYYTAHQDWFHRYLGGDPPPWSVDNFAANAVFDPATGRRIDGDANGD